MPLSLQPPGIVNSKREFPVDMFRNKNNLVGVGQVNTDNCLASDLASSFPIPTCADAFNAKIKNHILGGDVFDSANVITVSLDSKIQGKFGGENWKLRKNGRIWHYKAGVSVFAPAGDPRWFFEVFGPKAANYFGFKMEGDDMLFVPDAKELNEAIARIN